MQRRTAAAFATVAVTTALAAMTLCAPAAQAQAWPTQPVRILVGSSPGGGTDAMARAVADKLGPALKGTVIVENRPGASNTLAADVTAKSTDGHTMVMGVSTAHAIAPHLLKLAYNSDKDLVPVAFVGAVPNVLVVNNDLGVNSVAELVALAKKNPGKLNYASSGSGSSPALIDLMGGQVQMSFDTLASVAGHIKSGKVKALAVAAAKRNPQLPDVPTLAEAGVKGVEMSAWYGVYMPAATPKPVQQRVHEEVNKLLPLPDTRTRLAAIGSDIAPLSQAEFAAFHDAENKRYAEVIKKRGIKLD
jgi:tripartite-type tricarboxylate transporter receptor subunit TctC